MPVPQQKIAYLPEMDRPPLEVAQLTADAITKIRRSLGLVSLGLEDAGSLGFAARVPDDDNNGKPFGMYYAHFGYEGLSAMPDNRPDTVLRHAYAAPRSQSYVDEMGNCRWVGIDWLGDDNQPFHVDTILELQDTMAAGILNRADLIVRTAQGL